MDFGRAQGGINRGCKHTVQTDDLSHGDGGGKDEMGIKQAYRLEVESQRRRLGRLNCSGVDGGGGRERLLDEAEDWGLVVVVSLCRDSRCEGRGINNPFLLWKQVTAGPNVAVARAKPLFGVPVRLRPTRSP